MYCHLFMVHSVVAALYCIYSLVWLVSGKCCSCLSELLCSFMLMCILSLWNVSSIDSESLQVQHLTLLLFKRSYLPFEVHFMLFCCFQKSFLCTMLLMCSCICVHNIVKWMTRGHLSAILQLQCLHQCHGNWYALSHECHCVDSVAVAKCNISYLYCSSAFSSF